MILSNQTQNSAGTVSFSQAPSPPQHTLKYRNRPVLFSAQRALVFKHAGFHPIKNHTNSDQKAIPNTSGISCSFAKPQQNHTFVNLRYNLRIAIVKRTALCYNKNVCIGLLLHVRPILSVTLKAAYLQQNHPCINRFTLLMSQWPKQSYSLRNFGTAQLYLSHSSKTLTIKEI